MAAVVQGYGPQIKKISGALSEGSRFGVTVGDVRDTGSLVVLKFNLTDKTPSPNAARNGAAVDLLKKCEDITQVGSLSELSANSLYIQVDVKGIRAKTYVNLCFTGLPAARP